jgi:hypothetical protein
MYPVVVRFGLKKIGELRFCEGVNACNDRRRINPERANATTVEKRKPKDLL